MMDLDALTWKLLEETAELQKALASAYQDGWHTTHPSAKAPNIELVIHELDDVIPAACRLWYELTQIRLMRSGSNLCDLELRIAGSAGRRDPSPGGGPGGRLKPQDRGASE